MGMSSQDSSTDGGMHLGRSIGAIEYHGISSYQWAALLLLVIIVVWLNLRYRRKSRIASDAKRGILPPLAPQQACESETRTSDCRNGDSSGTRNMNDTFSEETYRRQTGRQDYPEARARADNIRKAREIFNSNSFEDIKWRQKFSATQRKSRT